MDTDQRGGNDASEAPGALPDPEEVARRAEGRPPEERSSEDPRAQAEAILQDSEDRISEGAERSERPPFSGMGKPSARPCRRKNRRSMVANGGT